MLLDWDRTIVRAQCDLDRIHIHWLGDPARHITCAEAEELRSALALCLRHARAYKRQVAQKNKARKKAKQ